MPDSIRFHKYTALGNNFVLIDELDGVVLEERVKSRFAQEYTDADFGIGADGVLFAQRPGRQVFDDIRQTHGHRWQAPDVLQRMEAALCSNVFQADAIMRLIEPNGQESSMCGNGIRCVADHLSRKLGKEDLIIVAEVTTLTPRAKPVLQGTLPDTYRVRMGSNARLPTQFRTPSYDQVVQSCSNTVDLVELAVSLSWSGEKCSLALRGYLTYTGEPHLVFFTADTPWVRKKLDLGQAHLGTFFEEKKAHSGRILHRLGDTLNGRCLEQDGSMGMFNPDEGINVNIAAIDPNRSEIRVRTYERGGWGETKACGTGATAVAAIAYELGLIGSTRIRVLTEGSVFRPPGSALAPSYARRIGELVVEKRGDDWWLEGPANRIYTGTLSDWRERLRTGDELVMVLEPSQARAESGLRMPSFSVVS